MYVYIYIYIHILVLAAPSPPLPASARTCIVFYYSILYVYILCICIYIYIYIYIYGSRGPAEEGRPGAAKGKRAAAETRHLCACGLRRGEAQSLSRDRASPGVRLWEKRGCASVEAARLAAPRQSRRRQVARKASTDGSGAAMLTIPAPARRGAPRISRTLRSACALELASPPRTSCCRPCHVCKFALRTSCCRCAHLLCKSALKTVLGTGIVSTGEAPA